MRDERDEREKERGKQVFLTLKVVAKNFNDSYTCGGRTFVWTTKNERVFFSLFFFPLAYFSRNSRSVICCFAFYQKVSSQREKERERERETDMLLLLLLLFMLS